MTGEAEAEAKVDVSVGDEEAVGEGGGEVFDEGEV